MKIKQSLLPLYRKYGEVLRYLISGVYTLNFTGTPAERTARVLSLVSILLFAAFIGFRRKYVHKHCHSLL